MVRTETIDACNTSNRVTRNNSQNTNAAEGTTNNCRENPEDSIAERRVLRSRYLRFKNRISGERDDISKVDSDLFKAIIEEVDSLHQLVQKPREQVADAEALYDITSTLVSSVKSYSNEGVTPADFISCLLGDFGGQNNESIQWKDIGKVVSDVFKSAPGCSTMVGPMNTEMKQRKVAVHKRHTKTMENARPEELDESAHKEKTDTDKNMATMFNILRMKRKVQLENLILNRNSFAQTVENFFALSFLIKDGRAEITVDENGCHIVSPRNAPSATQIQSGEASYTHFIFRVDYRDWKLMLSSVGAGEELMPTRNEVNPSSSNELISSMNEVNPSSSNAEASSLPTTPIRKFSRNRGFVLQEKTVVEDSPESDNTQAAAKRDAAIRKGKRKIRH